MSDAVMGWTQAALRYRWFVGFGVIWLGIVTIVSPVLAPVGDDLSEDSPRAAAVRGTLGAVSSPTNSAADAIPISQGFDSTSGSGLGQPGSSTFDEPSTIDEPPPFDDAPPFEGFDSSDDEPEGETEAEPEEPAEETPPAGCTTDSSLPVPVVTTIVGATTGAQDQVSGATGQPLPADPADTAGAAVGCEGSASGNTAASPAPSLSNGIRVGGLTPVELLRILFGW